MFSPKNSAVEQPDRRITAAGIVLLAALAIASVFYGTAQWGIGIAPDSVAYISAANSLLMDGTLSVVEVEGKRTPLVHSAPLLPVLLAGFSAAFQTSPEVSARWLNALFLAFTVALAGFAALHFLKSRWMAWLAGLLVFTAAPMLNIHLLALSEPPYVFFSLLAMVLIALHWETPNMWLVVAAACAACLGIFTRYAGAALLCAGAVTLLIAPGRSWVARFRETAVFSLCSGLPFAAWLVRNHAVSGSVTTATVSARHIISFAAVKAGMSTLTSWMLPGMIPLALRVAIVLALSTIVYAGYRKSVAPGRPASLPAVMAIFVIAHVAFNAAAISFAYNDIPLDDRILLPILAPGVLVLISMWTQMERSARLPRLAWYAVASILVLVLASNVVRSAGLLRDAHASGKGYSSAQWRKAEIIQRLHSLPANVTVYTTLPSVFRYLTSHPARSLPETYFDRTMLVNPNYAHDYERMRNEAKNRGIAVVYLAQSPVNRFAGEAEVKQNLDLVFVTKDRFGSLHVSRALAPETLASRPNSQAGPN